MNIFALTHRQSGARVFIPSVLACIAAGLLWIAFHQRSVMLMLVGFLCFGGAGIWLELGNRRAMLDRERVHADAQRRRFERILDVVDDAWWEWNVSEDRHTLSARWWSMLGYAVDEHPADAGIWQRLAHPDDLEEIKRALLAALEQNTASAVIEMRLRHKDGEYIPLLTRYAIERDIDGKARHVAGVCVDLRERRHVEQQLQQAATVLATTREGILITDADGRITLVNQAFTDISGYSSSDAIGNTPALLQSGRHDATFYAAMWQTIARDGQWRGEIWNRRKSGEIYPELLTISAIKDRADNLCNYVGVFVDISMSKASEAELDFVVHHDPLTKFPNRLLFMSLLDHGIKIAHREDKQLALLMVDLDQFKDVNDSYGHAVGDELLQQAAERLRCRLRDMDTVARLGGDEFVLMLENINGPEGVANVANEIITLMDQPWLLSDDVQVHVGVSVGLSLFPEHGTNANELLQHADSALNKAKNEGRGCFRFFSENLTHAARERISLESRLHHAVENNELRVFYQPQVDIASGRIVGAEALVRWQDPLEGLMSPVRFIPIAEASGLITDIGAWVMMQTCLQGQSWIEAGLPPLTLAVNLSPKQFLHSNVENMITTALRLSGFPPTSLELELTESAFMEREEDVLDILNRMRTVGMRVAIDDFGTGYSSLSYLKRFPLDVLKIDKSFVDSLPHKQEDRAIASAIVAMGHALDFKILAEGGENAQQLAFLEQRGCDLYQGYLCSRPVPADNFAALVRDQQLANSVPA
ncbi:EAL domain-containing protein [Massilia sp. DJPM01]|uniref:putative bifunctional diguanylate cyclase/phosphodiesterase n=1 Tax=Massilia sp. DJPM01 TaxID=3024404 RepID=UPI00259DF70B|nr:EAL domain-containing protein [Massilia sp. DJPM01]MDM5179917.1 EAL domain-containing protein [Massilia sp. DJPM01]